MQNFQIKSIEAYFGLRLSLSKGDVAIHVHPPAIELSQILTVGRSYTFDCEYHFVHIGIIYSHLFRSFQ